MCSNYSPSGSSINEVNPNSAFARDNTNTNIVDNNAGVESDKAGNIKKLTDVQTEIPLRENKETTAFCVRCKKSHLMKEPKLEVLKNGKHALKGRCDNCDCTTFRIVRNDQGETVKPVFVDPAAASPTAEIAAKTAPPAKKKTTNNNRKKNNKK